MPAKSVTLGELTFPRKMDAQLHLKTMLQRYDPGDRVTDADAIILEAALRRHPESAEKIGCGIKGFSVRSADFGSKCFWVNRLDGSTDKFSYRACIYC
jgi:hypothetical protein